MAAAARSLQNQRVHATRLWYWQSVSSTQVSRSFSAGSVKTQEQKSVPATPPAGAAETYEAEPVGIPTPKLERTKILVLGGNGFVGSHVCKEAVGRGLPVLSLNREKSFTKWGLRLFTHQKSGRPSVQEPWVNEVDWIRGSLFDSHRWRDYLKEVTAVISCVGGFGSNDQMRKINGDANVAAINVAADTGVDRFVYISAANYNIPFLLKGYYDGKKAAEEAVRKNFPYSGVILRPGFIYGTRRVGSVNVPLGVVGGPLETLFRNLKPATQVPVVGPLLIPPVKVTAVAKTAVRAAIDNAIPPGALDVWGIIRFGDQP